MKNTKTLLSAALLSLAALFAACETTEVSREAETVTEEVNEASEAAGRFLEVRLAALQAEMEEAKRDAEQAGEEMSDEWNETMARLEREVDSIQKGLERNSERKRVQCQLMI